MNFSTRGQVIKNLPQRMFDIIFRPYPWQLQNTSQRLGAVGTVIAVVGFFALLGFAWRARGDVLRLIAPILYPFLFLLVAYSLSAGNAGTGFRYRSHLVLLGGAMLVILREHVHAMRARAAAAGVGGGLRRGSDEVVASVAVGQRYHLTASGWVVSQGNRGRTTCGVIDFMHEGAWSRSGPNQPEHKT